MKLSRPRPPGLQQGLCSLLKTETDKQAWRDGSWVKSTACTFKDPKFNPQHQGEAHSHV